MFHWQKIGKIFDPSEFPGREWMREFAQAPATLIFDDFIRVYFSCRPPADGSGQYVSNSAYVDLDRSNPKKILRLAGQPVLKRGETGTFDEFGIYPVSPVRHGEEVWLYYGGWTRCRSVPFDVAIGLAISRDQGTTFDKHGPGPVLGATLGEPFVISGPKIRRFNNQWHLFYIAGKKWVIDQGRPEPVYRIRMAVSDDGIQWKKLNRDLIPTCLGEDEAQASPDVFYAAGTYHMFFCARQGTDYRNAARGYRIGYASSTDLVHWERDDAKAGLNPSEEGWDSESVSYPHVLQVDGRTYMFYLGNGVGRHGFGAALLKQFPSGTPSL